MRSSRRVGNPAIGLANFRRSRTRTEGATRFDMAAEVSTGLREASGTRSLCLTTGSTESLDPAHAL